MGRTFSGVGESPTGSIRVLHVDDDPAITELTADWLERENEAFEIIAEHDAGAALDRLDAEAVDCVVSDYDMPGATGLDLLLSVREAYPDLPFVLFTGKGSEEVASDAISAGVDDYLQKSQGTEQYELLAARIENLVSERRAREAVDRREGRFRSLFENIPDPAVIIEFEDGEPTVRAANEAFESTFGYAADRAVGESLNELIVPAEEREDAAAIDRAAKAGEQIEREVRRQTADGEVRDFLFRNATITPFDADARPHFGVYTDVTTLRERERELELYEAIVNAAPDAIYALNREQEFVLVNRVLADVLDRSAEAVVGEPVTLLTEAGVVDAETVAARTDEFRAVLEGETEQVRFEATVTVDGEPVVTENHVSMVTEDGRPYALVNIVRDVTERREREEQLRRQNARLEEFASVVSHDLRNPLNVAGGNVRLARETGETEHLDRAERALDRMERFVEDLLTLAREGQTVRETLAVDLAAAAADAWASVDGDGQIAVELEGAQLRADPDRLQQVLENLLANAVEHGGEGVSVRVGLLESGRGFFVADDGRGLSPDEREAAFDHGYTTSTDGTGFGLSIVRGIVEAHGWSVEAVEAASGGARFEISGVEWADGEPAGRSDRSR